MNRGHPGAQTLEHLTHFVELGQIGDLEADDHGAAVGNALDQTTLLEHGKRLACPRARYAKLGRQFVFVQLGAGRDLLWRNTLAQNASDIGRRQRGGESGLRSRTSGRAGARALTGLTGLTGLTFPVHL